MSNVTRICPHCGAGVQLDLQFCGQCGGDMEDAQLPVQQRNLPAVLGRAAVPMLVGAASLAVRAGWKLLQSRSAAQVARRAMQTPQRRKEETAVESSRRRTTIRIRSTWAVGDANGVWQQGASEHIIELDD